MKENTRPLWFRAKDFGWGWQPLTWQGWLALAIYVLLLVREFLIANATQHSGSDMLFSFAVPVVLISGLFLLLCYGTGETPRWKWGAEKADK